jgi:glycosyltransferase involved in cell wall biosynthesis
MPETKLVLQFCHGYDGPFLDCARQYAALFDGTPYEVVTVYLTGKPDEAVRQGSHSKEVLFLDYSSAQVRGLKLKAIADLRRIARQYGFACCIAHRFKPVYTALLGTDLPVVGVHHAFGDYARLSRRLFANAFKKRLALLGVSDAVRDDMRRCLPAFLPERIETLHNRIDLAKAQAAQLPRGEARAALGLPQDAWVVGNVGRLHPDKDQATLLRAFALAQPELPKGSLLAILGQGRLEGALKRQAAELGIAGDVRFLGQVPEARRYFKAFDIFALPSDREPFGMVLLEALAAGLPLVASEGGGSGEVVSGIGQLFAFADDAALARCLARAAKEGVPAGYPERAARWVEARFGDRAARQAFWQLPMVKALLPEAGQAGIGC